MSSYAPHSVAPLTRKRQASDDTSDHQTPSKIPCLSPLAKEETVEDPSPTSASPGPRAVNKNLAVVDDGDDDDEAEEVPAEKPKMGRRKIVIKFIEDKAKRQRTCSKRNHGLMTKALELATLTGTQVLLLVASETGHVYTFATQKLQALVTHPDGKNMIQACLNAQDPETPDPKKERDDSTKSGDKDYPNSAYARKANGKVTSPVDTGLPSPTFFNPQMNGHHQHGNVRQVPVQQRSPPETSPAIGHAPPFPSPHMPVPMQEPLPPQHTHTHPGHSHSHHAHPPQRYMSVPQPGHPLSIHLPHDPSASLPSAVSTPATPRDLSSPEQYSNPPNTQGFRSLDLSSLPSAQPSSLPVSPFNSQSTNGNSQATTVGSNGTNTQAGGVVNGSVAFGESPKLQSPITPGMVQGGVVGFDRLYYAGQPRAV